MEGTKQVYLAGENVSSIHRVETSKVVVSSKNNEAVGSLVRLSTATWDYLIVEEPVSICVTFSANG